MRATNSLRRTTGWLLWIALLVTIPFTSSPWVGELAPGSVVKPLAGLPLIILLALWVVPSIIKQRSVPKLAIPLLLFLVVAALAFFGAGFIGIRPDLGQTVFGRGFRGYLTLLAGVGFYFTAAVFPKTSDDLRRSLRWLYVGGLLMLAWSSVQAFYVVSSIPFPPLVVELHNAFSVRPLLENRVTGLAYEPSWLANLLVVLYMPFWLASVIKRYSVVPPIFKRLSVEHLLLVWSITILFLSFSRVGLASALVVFTVLVLVLAWNKSNDLSSRAMSSLESKPSPSVRTTQYVMRGGILVIAIAFLLLTAWGLAAGAALIDSRIARLFESDFIDIATRAEHPALALSNRLAYAERVVYWDVGLKVFTKYPVLGVGLGNTGFFFRELAHVYGHRLPETIRILNGAPQFPNPKSLWIRLLSETGLVGFLVFVSWLAVMAAAAYKLYVRGLRLTSMVGLAGLLALVAQAIEGFSLDTFALPQLWITLGFVAAATGLVRVKIQDEKIDSND